MTQREFLQAFDAVAFTAFAEVGLADGARYQAPGSTEAVPCTVQIDRDVRDFGGDLAPVSTGHTLVTLQRAEVQPAKRGRVLLTGETLVLAERVREDESISQWVADHG
ncbi:hypothetical protein [Xanthomonas campestris]|uniref:head-tail joining protein n=1 Tax=Xanthomonas campestris TaxID=339 RepID=UPI002B22C705|nr:hypothetical protein [Xanthomonas campestris]MEA9657843.1 hypothetical protein [Xanthomonas campestris pv. raphani]MEB1134470.1 hypothetical protein [Xanthomonas campestris pv. campestris]MEB2040829.1 hypothetical protein [Xanthomonas campestris pv. campestris]